jgi:hypothetical protein
MKKHHPDNGRAPPRSRPPPRHLINRVLRTLSFLIVAALIACASPSAGYAQGLGNIVPGTSCPAYGVSAAPNWDSIVQCNSSLVWQRAAIALGDTSETCNASTAGKIKWTGAAFQACNGTSWTAFGGSGGSPAGANTQIQFNNSGAFGASANLTWDGTNLSARNFNTTATDGVYKINALMVMGYPHGGADNSSFAVGPSALVSQTANGLNNVALGLQAGQYISTGTDNTAVGQNAMRGSSSSNLTGSYNTGIGDRALFSIQGAADGNTALGYAALYSTSNAHNTAVGFQAGNSVTTGQGNILIGYDVDTPTAATSNYLNIGDTLYGDLANDRIGIGGFPFRPLHIQATDSSILLESPLAANQTTLISFTKTGEGTAYKWGIGRTTWTGWDGNTLAIFEGNSTATARLAILPGGNIGIGTITPQSRLHIPDGGYLQAEDNNAGAPPAADCDADAERGRLSIDTTNNRLYVCNGAARGWDYVTLTN